jgi:hypothetical protein
LLAAASSFPKDIPGSGGSRTTEGEGAVPGEALPLLAAVVALDPADLLADEVAIVAVEVARLQPAVGWTRVRARAS